MGASRRNGGDGFGGQKSVTHDGDWHAAIGGVAL
jgi:hypothetical protein